MRGALVRFVGSAALTCVAPGCGDNASFVMATVVRVGLTRSCDVCYGPYFDFCGANAARIDDHTTDLVVATSLDATDVQGLVQVQYINDSYLDFALTDGQAADVIAASDPEVVLYRIDGAGTVFDIDDTRLAEQDDHGLTFEYLTTASHGESFATRENHILAAPRELLVTTTTPSPCCSAGKPVDLSVTAGVVLLTITWRRKRKRRLERRRCWAE
ncbi:MAG: hypothetical protein AB7P03_29405 [Kofleriaceae bacterium]